MPAATETLKIVFSDEDLDQPGIWRQLLGHKIADELIDQAHNDAELGLHVMELGRKRKTA